MEGKSLFGARGISPGAGDAAGPAWVTMTMWSPTKPHLLRSRMLHRTKPGFSVLVPNSLSLP